MSKAATRKADEAERALRGLLDKMARVVLLDQDKCKPNLPAFDYLRKNSNMCPQACISVVAEGTRIQISEEACPACLNRAKRCPNDAVRIVNLPHSFAKMCTYRFGANGFKFHRLPVPRVNQVLGLVGTNGIGKTTALRLLAGSIRPTLNSTADGGVDWDETLAHFRGSELQTYFTRLLDEPMKAVTKLQFVDLLSRHLAGSVVLDVLTRLDTRGALESVLSSLELRPIAQRTVEQLSGGELQRVALAICLVQKADVYLFDEPSSYLDVGQRLNAARAIRSCAGPSTYVVCVEHDLTLLDYISDACCLCYGVRGAYGVASASLGSREGINAFLSGYLPTENLRFRSEALNFKAVHADPQAEAAGRPSAAAGRAEGDERGSAGVAASEAEAGRDGGDGGSGSSGGGGGGEWRYPALSKRLGSFSLRVESGSISPGEIVLLLGQNGVGKTCFVKMLAGQLRADGDVSLPELQVSYKPQYIAPKFDGCVSQLLEGHIGDALKHEGFAADVIKPLRLEPLMDRRVESLSGGELQRLAIALCLGKPADLYLIDEPSAYLDSEQRISVARMLKRFMRLTRKSCLVVEHDLMLATYLADHVIVYEGTPAVEAVARAPQPLHRGMNRFLEKLQVTFRRDPETHRPRINKLDSVVDKEQKASGHYFYLPEAGA